MTNHSHIQPTDDTLDGEFTEEEIARQRMFAEENGMTFKGAAEYWEWCADTHGCSDEVERKYRHLASIAKHLAEREGR